MHIWIKIVVLEYYNIVVSSNAIGKDMIVNRECEMQHRKRESAPALERRLFFTGGGNERNEWD